MKAPLTCVLFSVGKFQIEWEFVWPVYRHMGSETSIYMSGVRSLQYRYVSSMDSAFGLILRMYVASKIKQPSKDDDLSSPSSFI